MKVIVVLYTKLMMRYLYTLLLYAIIPFVLLRLLWQSRRLEGYRQRLFERFGYIDSIDLHTHSIWIHAVSVGEVTTAIPLIKALQKHYPHHILMITTTTPTGSLQVQKNFCTERVRHVYLPYDLPAPIKRFLTRVHPQFAIIMETELWPNLLHYTNRQNIPVLLANARLSERSMQNYRRINSMTKKMLSKITCVAAQSDADGNRFVRLGLLPERLVITGNMKFDLYIPTSLIQQGKSLRKTWGTRPTLIAASTHEGEEKILLEVFRRLRTHVPQAFLILVPRHPNRFAKVARLCEITGFSTVKRSLQQIPTKKTDILLGDTMGELCLLYAASDIAFVGGSLVPVGGHNLIEPAALHLPIISGHYLHNFIAVSELLKKENALIIVNDGQSLFNATSQLFKNSQEKNAVAKRVYQVSAANTGAVIKHIKLIEQVILPKLL